jgi:hypothetical protein
MKSAYRWVMERDISVVVAPQLKTDPVEFDRSFALIQLMNPQRGIQSEIHRGINHALRSGD